MSSVSQGNGQSTEERFFHLWSEVHDLASAEEILGWDQETMMPPAGLQGRAKVLSTIAGLRHERLVSPRLREALEETAAAAEAGSVLEAQTQEARRQIERAVKLPAGLARELAEVQSTGLAAWAEARKQSDFSLYRPSLEHMLQLKREQADALAGEQSPYEALMEEYEPGVTEADLVPLFDSLKQVLVPVIRTVAEERRAVDESPVQGRFAVESQRRLGLHLAEAIGFDFTAGRLDASAHPFCTGFNPGDVRLTWRWEEGDFRPALFGILHEAGHGLYEQGLPEAWLRTPLGAAASLGIHESQSRLWENLVARSRGFWQWALPILHRFLPDTEGVTVDTLWPALHTVRPSLIRVEADEATYNLHVAIRFDLERALMSGNLEVADLPEAWDDAYEKLLGVRAKRAADGVLQDIHWALGSLGYFPTYTLGTLAASQLFEAAEKDLGNLQEAFTQGTFRPLLQWLREHIHAHGSRYWTNDLLEKATGSPLQAEPFLAYIQGTVDEAYGP